ncbi:hypothetical protein BCR44DRAFT_1426402 [Catenaria anguillulae PL171]|uniref:Uncharacterized protein n=1 Tax=Catenaria anguillulae PL171 TaxID=765915 RepID=A0A1Y2HXY7_9FUNG|nr:hypothetical protein BCR44DRAFT_1426402 [Catenaria anguillulae PL171]
MYVAPVHDYLPASQPCTSKFSAFKSSTRPPCPNRKLAALPSGIHPTSNQVAFPDGEGDEPTSVVVFAVNHVQSRSWTTLHPSSPGPSATTASLHITRPYMINPTQQPTPSQRQEDLLLRGSRLPSVRPLLRRLCRVHRPLLCHLPLALLLVPRAHDVGILVQFRLQNDAAHSSSIRAS